MLAICSARLASHQRSPMKLSPKEWPSRPSGASCKRIKGGHRDRAAASPRELAGSRPALRGGASWTAGGEEKKTLRPSCERNGSVERRASCVVLQPIVPKNNSAA
jgi:hypothetical protein